jgi:uncharacterized membrane protein YbhN (UPF0104 family)
MSRHRAAGNLVRIMAAAAILTLLVWCLGAGPFLDGLRLVDARAVVAAVVLGAITTLACAWRWRAVSRCLGVDMTLARATAAYYRSLFLNTTLPMGVAGDVHRAVLHSRASGDSRGARSVAWERTAGQAVQFALTVIVLLLLPSPVRSWMPAVALVVVACVLALAFVIVVTRPSTATRAGRVLTAVRDDVRRGLMARETWPVVVTASIVIIVGNVATFVIAARIVGTDASLASLATIALLVLAAMSVPVSIAGWGPREGVAAWVFGAVGLGAAAGVTTAVVYGVMVLVATLPGAAVLAVESLRSAPSKGVVHG